ncbi:MAG: hypothetical protein ACJ8FV_21025, partial [Xanthobacteraceae bacterium]
VRLRCAFWRRFTICSPHRRAINATATMSRSLGDLIRMILFGTASLARECDEMSLERGAVHLREYLLKYGAKASRNIFDSSVDKKGRHHRAATSS